MSRSKFEKYDELREQLRAVKVPFSRQLKLDITVCVVRLVLVQGASANWPLLLANILTR